MNSKSNLFLSLVSLKGLIVACFICIFFIQCTEETKNEVGPKVLPTVSTLNPTAWDQFSITIQGNISSNGNDVMLERGFVYGLTPEIDINSNKTTVPVGVGPFYIKAEGLKEKTIYYFKAFAITKTGTAFGEVLAFSTSYGGLSKVSLNFALPARNDKDTIRFEAVVSERGGTDVLERGLIVSEKSGVGYNSGISALIFSFGQGLGTFSGSVFDLKSPIDSIKPNTQYFVKSFSRNKAGVSYSSEVTLRTSGPAVISNIGFKFIDGNARFEGKVNDVGGLEILEQGFLFGPKSVSNTNFKVGNANLTKIEILQFSDDKFFGTVSGSNLTVGNEYKFTSYLRNVRGYSYGKDIGEFRFLPIGSEFQGGIIYLSDVLKPKNTWIAAKNDLTSTYDWGCVGDSVGNKSNLTSVAVEESLENTDLILGPLGCSVVNGPNGAARVARAYTVPPTTPINNLKWNLPSLGDLKIMYDTLAKKNIGNFDRTNSYWSSSQVTESRAFSINFLDGKSDDAKKYRKFRVRPVRQIN